jgi:hypothetical protein
VWPFDEKMGSIVLFKPILNSQWSLIALRAMRAAPLARFRSNSACVRCQWQHFVFLSRFYFHVRLKIMVRPQSNFGWTEVELKSAPRLDFPQKLNFFCWTGTEKNKKSENRTSVNLSQTSKTSVEPRSDLKSNFGWTFSKNRKLRLFFILHELMHRPRAGVGEGCTVKTFLIVLKVFSKNLEKWFSQLRISRGIY